MDNKEEWYNQSNEDNLREQLQELEGKILEFQDMLLGFYDISPYQAYIKHFNLKN